MNNVLERIKSTMIDKNKIFPSILILIFYIYNALVYLTGWPEITRIFLAIIIGFIGYLYCFSILYNDIRVSIFIALMLVMGLYGKIYNKNISAGNLVATISYIGMGLIMLRYKMNYKITRAMFYGLAIFFLYKIFIRVPSNEVLHHVSRNYISVLMLINISLLYISAIDNNKRIAMTPAILCFIISIWAVGRGGIITSGLLLTGILFIKFFLKGNKQNKKILIIVSGLFLIIFIKIAIDLDFLSKYFVAFQTKGMETPRFFMYKEYLIAVKQKFLNFMLGAPLEETKTFVIYSGNFHNSFIQMHAYFGFLPFIVIVFFIFHSILFSIRTQNYVFVILIFILIVRAFTDRLFFSGYAEPLLYYYCFYPLVKPKEI